MGRRARAAGRDPAIRAALRGWAPRPTRGPGAEPGSIGAPRTRRAREGQPAVSGCAQRSGTRWRRRLHGSLGTGSGAKRAARGPTGLGEVPAWELRSSWHSPGLGSPSPGAGFPRDPRSFFLPFPLPLPSLRSDISPKMSALRKPGWATVKMTRDKFGPRACRKVCPRREKPAARQRGGVACRLQREA